jgi:glycosyltransferase involved in cell wall biosynthesis
VRVLIDAHMLGHRETGNETYVRGLLAGLASVDGITVAAAVPPGHPVDPTLTPTITQLPLPGNSSVRRLFSDLARLGERWKADVVHATYVAPYRLRCPVVVSVHDVSFKRFPEYFSRRDRLLFSMLLPSSLRRSAAILTLSSHSRDEIRYFYPGLRVPVHVVPAAPSQVFRPLNPLVVSTILSRLQVRRPFLLAVGSVQPRKNLARLVEAFAEVRRDHPALHLVLVGPRGFRAAALQETIVARGLADAVQLLGYVSDDELAALYNGAIALVYPSVYEGFGLPVVEAMACGRPVIAANTSSLPEVAGEAALLVDPFDVSALRDAMQRLVANPQEANELAARGLARVTQFSWERTAGAALVAFRAARESHGRTSGGER